MLSMYKNNNNNNNNNKNSTIKHSNRSLYSNNNVNISHNNQQEPRRCVYYNGDTYNVEICFFFSRVFLLATNGMVGSHPSFHRDLMVVTGHIKEG